MTAEAGGAGRCGICGAPRPATACEACGGSALASAIATGLTRRLLGAPRALSALPLDDMRSGVILGPAAGWGAMLEARFACVAAAPGGVPPLDLARPEDAALWLPADFVVCVQELARTPPPVAIAAGTLAALLRPGGILMLAEPGGAMPATVEHVPRHGEARVVALDGRRVLLNRTADGRIETFDSLDFPDDGDRPVLRRFATHELIALLEQAGFTEVAPLAEVSGMVLLGARKAG